MGATSSVSSQGCNGHNVHCLLFSVPVKNPRSRIHVSSRIMFFPHDLARELNDGRRQPRRNDQLGQHLVSASCSRVAYISLKRGNLNGEIIDNIMDFAYISMRSMRTFDGTPLLCTEKDWLDLWGQSSSAERVWTMPLFKEVSSSMPSGLTFGAVLQ